MAALPMLREAQSLVQAPLLPEEPDDGWLAEARRAHTHRMHRGLVEAAAKVAGLPDGDAAHWAEAALECDPLDESAWLALLRSHEASGQHADGVRAYERCRRLYAAELGCAPGAGLQEAYVRLLRGAHEDDGELSLRRRRRPAVHPMPAPRARIEVGNHAKRPTRDRPESRAYAIAGHQFWRRAVCV